MNVHHTPDKTRTQPVRRWMPIDKWLELWERTHDTRYGNVYGRNPAEVVTKTEETR